MDRAGALAPLASVRNGRERRKRDTYIARAPMKHANVGRPARTKSELVSQALDDGFITLAELNGP